MCIYVYVYVGLYRIGLYVYIYVDVHISQQRRIEGCKGDACQRTEIVQEKSFIKRVEVLMYRALNDDEV